MALSKKNTKTNPETAEKKEEKAINHQCVVTRIHEFDDSIAFDIKVNQVMLYGLSYRTNDDNSAWIAFPSKKGNDGKYYKHCFVKFSDEDIESIEKQIEALRQ